MKSLLLSLLILTGFAASANTYYFSATGSDANNGTAATTPWQTIAKFNSVFASKSPGDIFLFHRGDSFYGSLIISRSGSAGSPITIGAYGSGAMPVVTGLTTINAWTNLGSNIWESTAAASTLSYTNMVVVNGANTPMGRFPNTGYFHFQSHSGITSITSSDLTGATNWTGAELAMNIATYRTVRNHITSQSGGTLTYTPDPEGAGFQSDNQQFIIQNDARTLDVQNEWYYNKSTKKLRIYSTVTPAGVQIATLDSLVVLTGRSYITFDNISFQGANTSSIQINHSPNITVQNCDFNFSGRNAVFGSKTGSSLVLLIQNCTINHINDNAIDIPRVDFDNATIRLNTLKNCGVIYGMMDVNDGINNNSTAQAISASGEGVLIEYNTLDSIGFVGIHFFGSNTTVQNNYIMDYCLLLNDGGGIYSWNGGRQSIQSGIKILNNIVLNRNTQSAVNTADYGVYLDDLSNNIEIAGNTCANSGWGIELHNVFAVNVHNNTTYNNSMASILLISDNDAGSVAGQTNMNNINIKNNIFFAKTATQKTFWIYAKIAPLLPPNLNSDSSYFSRPIDNNGSSLLTNFNDQSGQLISRTLSTWQPYSGEDAHSGTTPKAVTNLSDLRFEYNATSSPVTITLDANYIDIKNVSYQGTITLAPFTSAVLMKNGVATNIAPTANAGADQSITLPTNNVSLSGSGADIDGTISAYSWTKISGPSAGTITSAASAATTITAMAQGTYQFQLKVTDNNAATTLDTVQVTVKAANIAPTANAGTDQSITSPVSSVSLSGSGADTDGTISAYSWTKISGPSAGTITSAASAATTITAMAQGTYQFQLKVTDNNAATTLDTVQVTVKAANIAPTANAGTDQSITLPVSSVSLSGSGADTDGTISAYSWTKISGPSAGTITSTASAATTVTAMAQGTYQFQLKVTDNNSATTLDTVQVAVKAANIAPTANAGADQSITLPVSSVSLSGSGADTDGTISAYSWTKISGPSAGTITSAASAATTVTAMAQGTYQFQLKVTDNNAATTLDTVQVAVKAANIAPTANAGTDQSITLPVSSVSLSGSGADTDGTISAYSWTKISGPSAGTITSAASAATTVTAMAQGTYQFQLKVTDNNAATTLDTVQVSVKAANIAPTANAGTDQSITLPVSSVSLSGSGADTDGTISAYSWTKISGPSAGTITSAASAATTVTAMAQGTYQFQLKVTDNNAATTLDTVQVAVKAANIAPTANAGTDQSITLPVSSVSLSGSGADTDGTISAYSWTKISGPSAGTITSAASAATTVTAMAQGTYQFQLKVTDNNAATTLDTVQVSVKAANIAPTANAGTDQSITLPVSSVSLSGSGADTDGTISAYSWTKISGPSAGTITSAASAATTVTAMAQGTYQFQLKVTDNNAATTLDTVQVSVKAANIAPTANAGTDQSITLPVSSVSLSGSGADADGTISAYSWTKISGPSTGTITSAASAATTVTAMAQGVYQFQLKVTDNNAATTLDTVQVAVKAANIAPTANAGTDQSITLPVSSVSLSGSGADTDGTISAYSWTMISGPSAGTITNAASAATTATGLAQGVYLFQLKVTDNSAATTLDTVQVAVKAANIAPTADAGTDQSITLPVSSVLLSGSGADTDGTISAYSWTMISGPSAGTITNAASAATTATGLAQGVYLFQLKVTDNSAATTLDTVQVAVKAANIAPTANAGTDQSITLPVSSVSLSGSGADTDGTISAYSWTMISGPSADTITNAASAATTVTGLAQGVYLFQLKVLDNSAAMTFDTVQVTVNAAVALLPAVYPNDIVNGLAYKYYEGTNYTSVPDFSALTPLKTGTCRNFNISIANTATGFAFSFSGFITVPSDGVYTFYTTSDDGSRLYIDSVPVVNNDGAHDAMEKSGTIGLKAGKHAISVGYFQQDSGSVLNVNYSGPWISKRAVAASSLYRYSTQTVGYTMSMDVTGFNQISSPQVSVKAYPNPFVNNIEVSIGGGVAGEYKLILIDASGKTIWIKNGTKDAGDFQQSVNTFNLISGIYFLKVIQNNIVSVVKLVK